MDTSKDKKHHYNLTVAWTGNKGEGTQNYRTYERSHTVFIENKADILCSSDPSFRGDKTKHNPEELFLASLSGCHMLWFLHLCSVAGITVVEYTDQAIGTMIENSNGSGYFEEVTLKPKVVITDITMIEKANALHHEANKYCFIANSCNFPVKHEPICTVKND
ncbi:MAG: peroxiredoxin [Thalassobius sp.]|nr:peroxiredoxin [Thalassovita sp.]